MNFEISIPLVKIFLKEVFLRSLFYDLSKNLNFSNEWWIMQDLLNKNKNILKEYLKLSLKKNNHTRLEDHHEIKRI